MIGWHGRAHRGKAAPGGGLKGDAREGRGRNEGAEAGKNQINARVSTIMGASGLSCGSVRTARMEGDSRARAEQLAHGVATDRVGGLCLSGSAISALCCDSSRVGRRTRSP